MPPGSASTPIAIIGFACRFPGGADSLDYWHLLENGSCTITELPPDRLDRSLYFSPERGSIGKSYCTIGGVVPAPQASSPGFHEVDEAHRHLADVVKEACREARLPLHGAVMDSAGLYLAHLRGTALAAGFTYAQSIGEFIEELRRINRFDLLPRMLRDCIADQIVGEVRRSYPPLWQEGRASHLHPTAALKLLRLLTGCGGPAVNVDAACASSFQALDLAVRALSAGEIETALVASASYNNWHSLVLFSRAQALSSRGSFPFDTRADGFVSSDGYAALVLKPLHAAERDGNAIHGVIRGIGISSDGAGRSLWAPRKEGQVEAIRRAWAGGPDPARLQYVEAHGTSTQLGDATEIAALAEALGPALAGRRFPLASVKGNIGHTRESAGLAGLIKCLLGMRHGCIPPAAGFATPNPEIAWDRIPFYVPTALTEWPQADGGPRLAAIDSFGIGGLNAHVIIEEYAATRRIASVPAAKAEPEPLAVIGAGCVLPGAGSLEEFHALVRSGHDVRRPVSEGRWRHPPNASRPLGGFVDFQYDWKRHKIAPKLLEMADPLQFMILDAADQALHSVANLNRRRAAVVVGTVFSGEFRNQLNLGLHVPDFKARLVRIATDDGVDAEEASRLGDDFGSRFLEHYPAILDETGSFTSSTLASRLARTFDLMGGAFAVDAGECGSLAALSAAAQLLRSGDCDVALCAAGQRAMDALSFELVEQLNASWSPAEGAVVLLLKRLADAQSAGDPILGTIGEITAGNCAETAPHDPIVGKIGHTYAAAGLVSVLKHLAMKEDATVRITADAGFTACADVAQLPAAGRKRAAFVFGGQGAQYPEMLRPLVEQCPPAAAAMAECDSVFREHGLLSFAELCWSADDPGEHVLHAQLAALAAGHILYRAVTAAGVRPEVVAGYSYGDFAALVAAGSLTLGDAVAITVERSRLLGALEGGLLAITATPGEFETAALPGVHLAIDAGPRRLIVGGSHDDLAAFAREADRRGWSPLPLAVPRPFHTPILHSAAEEFARVLESRRFRPPPIPYFSTLEVRYIVDPGEIRASLVRHLTDPIRYHASIRRLSAEDAGTVFVEIGPRRLLTDLHRRILPDVAAFSTDHAARPLAPLKKLQAFFGVDAPIHATMSVPLFFDATQRRRSRNAATVTPTAVDEVEQFLVRFVCERTGYPASVVDLDADLEADLGIDSLKRAELLGEAHEVYRLDIGAGEKFALAEFSTLRRIHTFITKRHNATARASTDPSVLHLSGSPYDMGAQHARECRDVILRAVEDYAKLGGPAMRVDVPAALGPAAFEQLTGMAEALQVPMDRLAAYNLALCPDHLPGCSHFAVRTSAGVLAGANEDAPLVLQLGGALRPVVQISKPAGGLAHALAGAAGKVGGINGMNARGLTVTSALLLDRLGSAGADGGMFHPALVQRLLATAGGIDDVLRLLRATPRSGAWSMILSEGSTGRICHVEYDHSDVAVNDHQERALATNHALLLGAGKPHEHSVCRWNRLGRLLDEAEMTVTRAQAILLDRYDTSRRRQSAHATMNTVRRVDHLASILFAPAENALYTAPRDAAGFTRVPVASWSRYVLRLSPKPDDTLRRNLPRAVAILGDRPQQLAAALGASGAEVLTCTETTATEQLFAVRQWLMSSGASHESATGFALVALTNLGGDLGLGYEIPDPASAGPAGLLKSLAREYPNVTVKVVDAPPDRDPAPYALAELVSSSPAIETAWRDGVRHVIEPRQTAAIPNPEGEPRGAWVVTGGARGITALCANELAARYGLHLHILGRSDAREIDTPHHYYQCDVADRDSLAAVLQQIRSSEPITGILHGAGVEYSAGIENKRAEEVRETVRVKVEGAQNLIELTTHDPIRHFVSFGSAAGRFGGIGQTDYAMASEILAKLTARLRHDRPGCKAVTFHWPAWDGVGMAVRPQTRVMLEMAGRRLMPADDGVAHFIAELQAGVPEAEVLIFDGHSYRAPERIIHRSRTLDATTDFFLRDHLYRGESLLPAAASLALLVEAVAGDAAPLRVRNFAVRGPLRLADGKRQTVSIDATSAGNAFQSRLSVEGPHRLLAEAVVEPLPDGSGNELWPTPVEHSWTAYAYEAGRDLFYGESMRCLKEIAGGADSLHARIVPDARDEPWVIDPAVLDACLVACGSWAVCRFDVKPLAHGFGQIDIVRRPQPGEACLLTARYLGKEGDLLFFDFRLAGADDGTLCSARRCSLILMGDER